MMMPTANAPGGDDVDPPAPSLLGPVPVNDPQLRALRLAVIVMGVLIILGLIAVIGRIIYLSTRPAAQMPGSVAALAPTIQASLPAGAVIRSVAFNGERLAIHYDTAAGSGIAIVDLASGRTASRIQIVPEAPAR